MNKWTLVLLALITPLASPSVTAHANSVGFTEATYDVTNGQLAVTVVYDFSDFAMFGGGLDIIYDSEAIEFVGYTQAPLSADAQAAASPIGSLTEPGLYAGFGVGTFEFFNGMISAGDIGTFVFSFNGGYFGDYNTPCDAIICLVGNPINPFVSLEGADVTELLLSNGVTEIGPMPLPMPLPGAFWLMIAGVGALAGVGRTSSKA